MPSNPESNDSSPFDPALLTLAEMRRRLENGDLEVSAQTLRLLAGDLRQGVQRLAESLRRRQRRADDECRRLASLLSHESRLWQAGVRRVAGVDEVGVGPLAGPVVAAAVMVEPGTEILGVDDSKRLDPQRRERLALEIRSRALGVGVGLATVEEIDRLNIYHAALLAMRRAVAALPQEPEHLLVDARQIPELNLSQEALIHGDGRCFSIAAASIVAKTHRDALMEDLDRRYPGYGLAQHKGYGTAEHMDAIRSLGPSPVHRCSFGVLRELTGGCSALFYHLRAGLEGSPSREELSAIEAELAAAGEELTAGERGKLRTLLLRRLKATSRGGPPGSPEARSL